VARARDLTPRGPRSATIPLAILLVTGAADAACGQGQQRTARIQPEARADYIDARGATAHLGVGVSAPAGTYVRLGVVGAAGQTWRDGDAVAAGRIDAIARFVVDPLREFRWAPYAAGGLGAMYDGAERWRAVLVGSIGAEGPAVRGVMPAVEVGFGGGTRVGIVLRRAMPGRR
jgi:hypothetical protein